MRTNSRGKSRVDGQQQQRVKKREDENSDKRISLPWCGVGTSLPIGVAVLDNDFTNSPFFNVHTSNAPPHLSHDQRAASLSGTTIVASTHPSAIPIIVLPTLNPVAQHAERMEKEWCVLDDEMNAVRAAQCAAREEQRKIRAFKAQLSRMRAVEDERMRRRVRGGDNA